MYKVKYKSTTKEGNPAICDMYEPKRHYAKWNKSDTEKQKLHDLTPSWNLKVKLRKRGQNGG